MKKINENIHRTTDPVTRSWASHENNKYWIMLCGVALIGGVVSVFFWGIVYMAMVVK